MISVGENGTPYKISPRNRDVDVQRFKAEVMAHVRSIEQQYWNLLQAHVAASSCRRAVELARGLKDREQTKLANGRGTIADVAEASQRLEQFNLDLVTRTSDVVTTEQQLRKHLGSYGESTIAESCPSRLPPRRSSSPTGMNAWLSCSRNSRPIVQMEALVREAEGQVYGDGLAPTRTA